VSAQSSGNTTVSWVKRLKLHRNWPLVVAVSLVLTGVFLFLNVRHQYDSIPSAYSPEVKVAVNYWSLISEHKNLKASISPIFFIFFVSGTIVVLFGSSRSHRLAAIGLALMGSVCALMVCVGSTLSIDGAVLNHIESAEFNDRMYHLALSNTVGGGADWVESQYILFECDLSGENCLPLFWSLNRSYYDGSEGEPTLVVDVTDHQLNLQIRSETVYTIHAADATNDVHSHRANQPRYPSRAVSITPSAASISGSVQPSLRRRNSGSW